MAEGYARDRPGNYAEQARTYDLTRGASSTIVERLLAKLGPAAERSLLDIAGGTGNYARALAANGFRPIVVDASFEMVARSVMKIGGGRQITADAVSLPVADGSFDCAMCVVAIHLFADRPAAFAEVRRVLGRGPFVVMAYTRENLESLFVHEYFGGVWPGEEDAFTTEEIRGDLARAGFSRVDVETFVYTDAEGGSLVAMHTDPRLLADPDRLRNTSFWHRLPEHVRHEGLARLEADLRSGVLDRRVQASLAEAKITGHGTMFSAWP
jgi:ubiquinone/menaquinone biosynthesis C-methylase UbiE